MTFEILLGLVMLVVMLGAIFIGIQISFTLLFLALSFGYFALGKVVFDLAYFQTIGLMKEEVWLQQAPEGAYAVVYWEASDIARVFQSRMTSQEPFDKWFRDRILVEVHGMNPSAPPPPMNQMVMG